MAIGRAGEPAAARPGFRLLRRLVDDLGLAECSMGMTDDLEVAVEEGSTMVRVGTRGVRTRPARKPPAGGTSELTSVEEAAMAFFKKAMNYLGLGPDDAYDEYDCRSRPRAGPRAALVLRAGVRSTAARCAPSPPAPAAARPAGRPCAGLASPSQPSVTVRARSRFGGAHHAGRLRAAAALHRAAHAASTTRRRSADKFKEGVPVIVNLQDVEQGPAAPHHRLLRRPHLRARRHDGEGGQRACTSSRRPTCRCRPRIAAG